MSFSTKAAIVSGGSTSLAHMTWVGISTMNEDLFPIENGRFSNLSFQGGRLFFF